MIFLATVALLVVVSVPLRGGSLRRLAHLQVRWSGLLALSAAMQVVIFAVLADRIGHTLAGVGHIVSFLPAGVVVFANRSIRGMVAIGLGGAMNLAAVAANGGVMPASRWATLAAGRALQSESFRNSAPLQGARLRLLGDVFAWPAPLPGATPFSLGDVVLLAGFALALHAVCKPAPVEDHGNVPAR